MTFTHLDAQGTVAMVDVSSKPGTFRMARASGYIAMQPSTIALLTADALPKGNVLTTAKVAAVMAAKQTANLIPLCHPLLLSWVDVQFTVKSDRILIESIVKTKESTGVEMEALTAVSVAALTIYDMCKAVDKEMEIGVIRLLDKVGGKSSHQESYRPQTAILVLSDSVSAGKSVDRSGATLQQGFEAAGCTVCDMQVIADNQEEIIAMVEQWVAAGIELIVTTGGTGLGARDVTIDALLPRFTRRLTGVEQALLQWGQGKTRRAMLSRLAAGTIGNSLVICLPGSTGAVRDALEVLIPTIFHAFQMMHGEGHSA
uniref:Cyclic pyranopterin monophosphate synthase n=1 Tax=Chlorobium chlorochromatii (strain CaD3) TaxID=340177 RepID=Q3ARP8_CHLCH